MENESLLSLNGSIQEAYAMKNIVSFIVIALLMGTVAIAVGELFFR